MLQRVAAFCSVLQRVAVLAPYASIGIVLQQCLLRTASSIFLEFLVFKSSICNTFNHLIITFYLSFLAFSHVWGWDAISGRWDRAVAVCTAGWDHLFFLGF